MQLDQSTNQIDFPVQFDAVNVGDNWWDIIMLTISLLKTSTFLCRQRLATLLCRISAFRLLKLPQLTDSKGNLPNQTDHLVLQLEQTSCLYQQDHHDRSALVGTDLSPLLTCIDQALLQRQDRSVWLVGSSGQRGSWTEESDFLAAVL